MDRVAHSSNLQLRSWAVLFAFAIVLGSNRLADCQSPEASMPASISGYVTDLTGAVIPDATVSLISEAASGSPRVMVAETRTDVLGHFKVDAMRGAYLLGIKGEGFRRLVKLVKIEDAKQALGRVQLEVAGGSQVCTLPCSWPPPLEVLADNRYLSTLIQPVPIPGFQQPARRPRWHRWTWPI